VILTEKLTLRSSDLGLKGVTIQSIYDLTEITAFEISKLTEQYGLRFFFFLNRVSVRFFH